MKIEFVNHSSFVIEHAGVRMMCDPWFEGSVFNNGWALISKTRFAYEDFANIQFIWFSHEHPDHFFPPNIKKIAPEHRANIVVLFQVTKDKRVVNWCKKQGFKDVIELYPDKWEEVAPDFKVLCEHYEEGDSWICFKGEGLTYLNTNDCGITNAAQGQPILNKTGPVDVLLSQFSYAYWAGNPDQVAYRRGVAAKKLEWFSNQVKLFQAKTTIPIASYIYFSHVENSWLNDSINTPRKTVDHLKQTTSTTPVILYPGDRFTFGESHDNAPSIEQYEQDFAHIVEAQLYAETKSIERSELEGEAAKFLDDLKKTNRFYLKASLKPCHIHVPDLDSTYELSLGGFRDSERAAEACDVIMTSENLLFCFKFPYGLDTTQINGRLRKPEAGQYSRFYNFFRINQLKSRGLNPNSPSYLIGALKRKLVR